MSNATDAQRAKWAGALTRRILAYYEANPEEWLSIEDMAIKFDCTPKQAQDAVTNLRTDGRCEQETMRIIRLVPFKVPR